MFRKMVVRINGLSITDHSLWTGNILCLLINWCISNILLFKVHKVNKTYAKHSRFQITFDDTAKLWIITTMIVWFHSVCPLNSASGIQNFKAALLSVSLAVFFKTVWVMGEPPGLPSEHLLLFSPNKLIPLPNDYDWNNEVLEHGL